MASLIEHDDVLDMRDLAKLAESCEEIVKAYEAGDTDLDYDADDVIDAQETLAALAAMMADLAVPFGPVSDALTAYGDDEPTLIAESHFTAYAQEMAEEMGAVKKDAPWPLMHIDWEAAADELLPDYNECRLDGHDYYIRSV